MKKYLLSIAILALSFTVKAQTQQLPVIDTAYKGIQSVFISPVRAAYTDTTLATRLGAYVVSDNLKNSATFYWALLSSSGQILLNGNWTMSAEQYSLWCSENNPIIPVAQCNLYPFYLIGQAYNLTFIPDPSVTQKK